MITPKTVKLLICVRQNHKVPARVKIPWLEHLWNHENLFDIRVVRAYELIIAPGQEA